MSTIREWINNPEDFDTGRALFDRYGNLHSLKRLFNAPGGHRMKSKLIYELSKLVGKDEKGGPVQAAPIQQQTPPPPPPQVPVFKPDPTYAIQEEYPEEIKSMKTEAKDAWQKAFYLHSQLELLPSNEERRKAGEEIEKHINVNKAIWGKIEAWKKTGQLPEEKAAPSEPETTLPEDRAELKTMLFNNRAYISKNKDKKKPTKPKDLARWEEVMAKVEQRKAQNEEIERKLERKLNG